MKLSLLLLTASLMAGRRTAPRRRECSCRATTAAAPQEVIQAGYQEEPESRPGLFSHLATCSTTTAAPANRPLTRATRWSTNLRGCNRNRSPRMCPGLSPRPARERDRYRQPADCRRHGAAAGRSDDGRAARAMPSMPADTAALKPEVTGVRTPSRARSAARRTITPGSPGRARHPHPRRRPLDGPLRRRRPGGQVRRQPGPGPGGPMKDYHEGDTVCVSGAVVPGRRVPGQPGATL